MKSLDALWHEAQEREADARLAYGRVRLECNGERVGISSEDVLELRRFGHTVLMQFVCPRCAQRHWSKLFS
jgi:hypothetical protein